MSELNGDEPRRWPDQPVPLPGGTELLLRPIPKGDGWIGSWGGEPDEQPRHRVHFRQPFYLGKFVVTQAEWRAVAALSPELLESKVTPLPPDHRDRSMKILTMGVEQGVWTKEWVAEQIARVRTDEAWEAWYPRLGQLTGEYKQGGGPGVDPSKFKGDRRPVEQVSWDDAEAWLAAWRKWVMEEQSDGWLARRLRDKWELRLPGEAEWEYACRAGAQTEYWNGDGEAVLQEIGWYKGNSEGKTHDVDEPVKPGQGEDHPWGLVGMHGNVVEWCGDVYRAGCYRGRAGGDFALQEQLGEEESHDAQPRVVRGGSWGRTPTRCRSAFRFGDLPGFRGHYIGFRVCLAPGPAEPQTETVEVEQSAETESMAPSGTGTGDGVDLSRESFSAGEAGNQNFE